ncbi:MAG: phosphodiester glycosidase family protein [Clostridia bacterium]|nr:phosphodiester glycosidase family protein [Clostridia bacterium]
MKANSFSKALAMILSVVMLVGMLPMNVLAASVDYTPHDDYYKVISKDDYNLAPGIVESEIVLNNAAGGHRQVAHVVEVDLSNPYTKVIPSYKGMIPTPGKYGTQIMSKQAAYAEEHGYGNVVAAMNLSLSWYDSAYYAAHPELVGEPLGYMILDGEIYMNSQGQTAGAQTCVVINFDEKDGEARPEDMPKVQIRSTKDAITGWEEQVIPANFGFLVKDGVNQYAKNHTSDPASRSFVGVKEDGTFVMVMNDGRQAPYSTGFNSYEMAEFMLSLGCVQAVNGDGGGSSAFLSQRPGEELKVNCSPSDGAERDTTHGILVISTAPATGEFVRATISSEFDCYTPDSVVEFEALGSDLVGTKAEIPEDAVWQLSDDSFGTIEDGVFTSNGKEGEVAVQLVYNGEVVGEDTINIVMPDAIAYAQVNMVVPYGKEVEIVINATYDSMPVCIKPSDVEFVLSNPELGTLDGFTFRSAEEGTDAEPGTLTATIGDLTITANIALGKGTEIAYDFEDQNLEGWSISTNYPQYGPKGPNNNVKDDNGNYWYNGQNELGYISIVDETTGKVHSGDYALAMECDFTQIYETGFHALNMRFPMIDTTDAVTVGFWIYVPHDARFTDMTINSVLGEKFFADGSAMELCEGWHYLQLNAPSANEGFSGISVNADERASGKDADGNDYYNNVTTPNLNGKFVFYIDDISVDYSTAVEDRDNPVFGDPAVLSYNGESSYALEGQDVDYSNPTFEVYVSDYDADNATGLMASSAKAYIDGKEVDAKFSNGKITVSGVELADGVHTVKFEISDNAGNSAWVGGKVNVQAGSDSSVVRVEPQDPDADRLLIGSLYWLDVVASDIETIEEVEMTFDMNNASTWELDGMTAAAGFSAEWDVQEDDNIATITITRTGKNTEEGEAVLASIPVRTWESHITEYEGYEDQTPAVLVSRGIIWAQSIEIALERGVITYTDSYSDDTTGTFGMEDILVDTEFFFTNYTRKSVEGAQEWINEKKAAGVGFHEHTAEAMEDKPATCTETGYTGRTYCAVCESVVDWGTVLSEGDHTYEADVENAKLVCVCGEECTEIGLVEAAGKYYYNTVSGLASGWITINDEWYYFSPADYAGLDGEKAADSHIKYVFENGRVTTGVWETTDAGTRYWYGPRYYRNTTNDITASTPFEIDGKTYLFNRDGYMQTGLTRYWTANGVVIYYDCGSDGVASLVDGPYEDYFYVEGIRQTAYQLVEYEGDYYFINDGHKLAKNVKLYLSERFVEGKTFADGRAIQVGIYEFDEEGKMLIPGEKNGVIDDYLYIKDVKQVRYQLVEYKGDYYFINDGDKIAKNIKLYLSERFVEGKTFADGRAIQVGFYEFDADGKMIIPEYKNGVIGDYLYINDVKQVRYQLVEFEGNYYFINDGDKIAKNIKLYLSERFVEGKTFADGRAVQVGYYVFDEEGKMIVPELKHGVIDDILYINDVKQVRYQLVEFEGDYYFVNDGDKIAKNIKLYLSERFVEGKTFADGRAVQVGYYVFDEEGKMIIPELKNGVVGDYLYIDDVKQVRYQLVEFEGDYYFINDGDKVAKNTKLYLSERFVEGKTFADGTAIQPGLYEFDADGKMIIE